MVAPVELVDVSASEENTPLDLMRLNYAFSDAMLSILERLDGKALCTCACVCGDLSTAAHDEALWSSLAHELKPDWTSSTNSRFAEEPTWRCYQNLGPASYCESTCDDGWIDPDDDLCGQDDNCNCSAPGAPGGSPWAYGGLFAVVFLLQRRR